MAGKTAILAVKIISDATGARRGLEETGGLVGKLGGLGTAAVAGLGAAVTAVGAVAVAGVHAAANLEQSIGAVDTVFKDGAGQMHAWAAAAATSVGLTKNEYNELGTLIGTQLKNGGTAMDQLGPKTNELIGLGADLASMFGGTTADAVGALSSALKGERDPIERYGVSLTQAAIDAKAAELGFTKVGGALSTEATQAATLALIMQQTADAHGNFAKESDTIQGQTQRLNAQWQNTVSTIGTALLPILNELLGLFNAHVMPAVQNVTAAFVEFMGGLDVGAGIDTLLTAVKPLADGMAALGTNLAPIGAILMDIITNGVLPLAAGIAEGLGPIITALADTVLPPLMTALDAIKPAVITVMQVLGEMAATIGAVLGPTIRDLAPVVTTVFGVVSRVIGSALNAVAGVIRTVTAIIRGDWEGAWNGIRDVLSGVWNTITSIVGGAIDIVRSILSNLAGQFSSIGWDMMAGLVNGLNSALGWVANTARNIALAAINAAKSALGIRSPSRVFAQIGTQTGQGLASGLTGQAGAVKRASQALVDSAIPSNAPKLTIDAEIAGRYMDGRAGAAGGDTITVNINGGMIDDATLDKLVDALNRRSRRRGFSDGNVRVYQ